LVLLRLLLCYTPAMRILFLTATRIGDAVLSTGLLDHLIRTYPQARITVACGPVAAGLFERMPQREATLVVEKRRHDVHWVALWARTVGTWWDLVVDLRGSALSFLLPARQRRVMRGGRRAGHRLGHLAGVLGLDPAPLPVAWTGEADREAAAALARTLLVARPGARVVVFAGPGEAERLMAAPLLAALPGAVDLVGRLALPGAAACLVRCAVFVGNDSGLMHLAAAAGAPTLGLFGPTPASEYAPSGTCAAAAVAEGRPGEVAIETLTVDAVVRAAEALLARAEARA